MTQIRISVDINLEKGDPDAVIAFLQDPRTSKRLNDFAAHVLIAEDIDGVKIKTVGGNAHQCEPSRDYACAYCRQQAKAWPQDIYPRAILAQN